MSSKQHFTHYTYPYKCHVCGQPLDPDEDAIARRDGNDRVYAHMRCDLSYRSVFSRCEVGPPDDLVKKEGAW